MSAKIPVPTPVKSTEESCPTAVDLERLESAARLLERAGNHAGNESAIHYLLFLACKRQGKNNEARNALRKIKSFATDANVMLQMALLSLKDSQLEQAESELLRAWELDSTSYEICYNLLLTQLTLGKVEACLTLLPRAIALLEKYADRKAGAAEERRFLIVLQSLLKTCSRDSNGRPDSTLAELTPQEERRLLEVIRSLGQLDTAVQLLRVFAGARPRSVPVREAFGEALIVKAKQLVDRCNWTEAELLLRPLARERGFSRNCQLAMLNLLGCCACLTQDFDSAIAYYQQALKLQPNEPRLQQNLALTYELHGQLVQADPHWNLFFDLVDERIPSPDDMREYPQQLAYEALTRLANKYSEKEKWSSAISYMQRASQVRPNDGETLEKLFHLYSQAKRTGDARKTLEHLRRIKPGEPQYELYELDLIEVKGLNDIEKLLTEIDRIQKRYPNDARVDERAVSMVGNVIPLMSNLCDQLTDQMGKVVDQIRSLPNYQINWAAVREVMRDLLKEFQKLRRITGKCLPLVSSEEQRRIVRDLAEHIDRKMEACRSMGA